MEGARGAVDRPMAAATLKGVLGLRSEPVAVKFFTREVELAGFVKPGEQRYCQILMGAAKGRKYLLTAQNIACPAAAWAFGFREPPATLASGEMPFKMGIFGNPEAVRNTLRSMTRLEMGKYRMVACCPLAEAPLDPDVVVLESDVEHLMWVALALVFETGGRVSFDTAILQATCVDATVIPFVQGRFNASLGCYGCREATDLKEGEAVLGFPIGDLPGIAASLKKLGEKAIPRVRGKPVWKALLARQRPAG